LKYLGVRLVAKATNNYRISRYYGLGLLFCFIPFLAPLLIAISLREAGKVLNNIRFVEAAKWYEWGAIGLFIGIGVFLLWVGWVYEAQGVWHLHEISEGMNNSEIERKGEQDMRGEENLERVKKRYRRALLIVSIVFFIYLVWTLRAVVYYYSLPCYTYDEVLSMFWHGGRILDYKYGRPVYGPSFSDMCTGTFSVRLFPLSAYTSKKGLKARAEISEGYVETIWFPNGEFVHFEPFWGPKVNKKGEAILRIGKDYFLLRLRYGPMKAIVEEWARANKCRVVDYPYKEYKSPYKKYETLVESPPEPTYKKEQRLSVSPTPQQVKPKVSIKQVKPKVSITLPPALGVGICPDSQWRRLTEDDLEGKSAWELDIMRNEIYARHGRLFKMAKYRDYFRKQGWYKENPNFKDDQLTEIEKYNAWFILQYQKRTGLTTD
jgi:hypothetical protein